MAWAELETTPDGKIVGANDAEMATDAVPKSEPVILPDTFSDPVTSNPLVNNAYPSKYDAVTAVVARVANDAVVENDAEVAVGVVVANDALVLKDAVTERLLVPNKELVTPPLVIFILPERMFNEPVCIFVPLTNKLLVYVLFHRVVALPRSIVAPVSGA